MLKKITLIMLITISQLILSYSEVRSLSVKELETIKKDVSNDHQLERVITVAELNEMMVKIEEDLDELSYLDRPDTQEICVILEAKKEVIQELLAKITASIRNRDDSALSDGTKKIIIGSSIGLGIIAIGACLLAAYDADNGWNAPTTDVLVKNIKKIYS